MQCILVFIKLWEGCSKIRDSSTLKASVRIIRSTIYLRLNIHLPLYCSAKKLYQKPQSATKIIISAYYPKLSFSFSKSYPWLVYIPKPWIVKFCNIWTVKQIMASKVLRVCLCFTCFVYLIRAITVNSQQLLNYMYFQHIAELSTPSCPVATPFCKGIFAPKSIPTDITYLKLDEGELFSEVVAVDAFYIIWSNAAFKLNVKRTKL